MSEKFDMAFCERLEEFTKGVKDNIELRRQCELDRIGASREINSVRIVEVVRVIAFLGEGTKEDPKRTIAQYWTKTGKLLFVEDPVNTYNENFL